MSASSEYEAGVLQHILAGISTDDLINELEHRDGIYTYDIKSNMEYKIIYKEGSEDRFDPRPWKSLEAYDGPAQIVTYVK